MAKSLQALGTTYSLRFLYSYSHNTTPCESQNPKAEPVVVVVLLFVIVRVVVVAVVVVLIVVVVVVSLF